MLRTVQSFSLDGETKLSFQPKTKQKTNYFLRSLVKYRKLRPKSLEPNYSNQQIVTQKIGPSRRKSCYCNYCGLNSKKQQKYMDLQLINKSTLVKKLHDHNDRNRSIFYRRNTQKKDERTDFVKSPIHDIGESKNSDWYVRQFVKRKSRINVQKFVDNSFSKNSQQSNNKLFDLMNVKSQQSIHLPYCINSPSVRIRTMGTFDQDNTITSPKQKDLPKLSPYLSFRQLQLNLLAPIKQKSNISLTKKVQKKILSYTKT
ncbi:unnamed protein product [Paramecium sonneborni]|uniref:Uncharacterized protein n=1 Tax=Paramecium sonneborni TaxID=65129 RepID=A0A8S1QYP1_9CILI|nr:unnamed protein product [Paramecium sonneborni]